MKNYQVIARSNRFLYLNVKGKLLSIYINHMLSEEDIVNMYYDLPFVKNQDEAQELLDLKCAEEWKDCMASVDQDNQRYQHGK